MRTFEQVKALREQLIAEGTPMPDTIRQVALACLDWPYVFGAWGEQCTPANRKRRARDDHPTIVSKCQVLRVKDRKDSCHGCQWYPNDDTVLCYDCRGFTRWLLQCVGLDITGAGATSQYNTASNWTERGKIASMPDVVCCVFKDVNGTKEHTGMHIGGGIIVHCSGTVRTGKTSDRGWTHYAIPTGLYGGEPVRPTLRRGAQGEIVKELQTILTNMGYDCGEIDGIFGKKTQAAVVRLQQDHGLEADGVVGRQTWAVLDAGEPVQRYTVKCYGMTWQQVMQLREICPTAEVSKE